MDECLLQICETHVDLLGNPNSLSNILEWLDTVAGVFHKLDKHHRVVPNFDYIFRLKVKCYLMKIKHYFIFFFNIRHQWWSGTLNSSSATWDQVNTRFSSNIYLHVDL